MAVITLDIGEMESLVSAIADSVAARIQGSIKTLAPVTPETRLLSVPPSVFGDAKFWGEADKQWGWVFGAYELWNIDMVCKYLGNCERKTIERLNAEGKIRSGKTATAGGRRLYCSRSIAKYASSLES